MTLPEIETSTLTVLMEGRPLKCGEIATRINTTPLLVGRAIRRLSSAGMLYKDHDFYMIQFTPPLFDIDALVDSSVYRKDQES